MLADNIDYNYLKHFIKVNTTRHESIAIAIPGQPDTRLAKAEDELYNELCAQHDRAGLFVSAKADEITRRLRMRDPCAPMPCHGSQGRSTLQLLRTGCANFLYRAPVTASTTTYFTMHQRHITAQAATKVQEARARGHQLWRRYQGPPAVRQCTGHGIQETPEEIQGETPHATRITRDTANALDRNGPARPR